MAYYNIKFKDGSESLMHYGTKGSGRYKKGSQNNAGNKHQYIYVNGKGYMIDENKHIRDDDGLEGYDSYGLKEKNSKGKWKKSNKIFTTPDNPRDGIIGGLGEEKKKRRYNYNRCV